MDGSRSDRLSEHLRTIAAEFFQRESNRQALLTVTRVDLSPDLARAIILFTVLPQDAEAQALSFARRNAGEFREFAKKHITSKRIPHFVFEIDEGEKNRQKIDTLTKE